MSAHAGERAIERVALADLGKIARGTAYVESMVVVGGESSVRLAYPFGRAVEALVPTEPTMSERPVGLHQVFSVIVRLGNGVPRCSALGSSDDGPRRVDVDLTAALGLAVAGVRTVFTTD